MKYNIEINYQTGNSFNTYDETELLDSGDAWENLDICKENLQAIKEHYLLYKTNNDYYKKSNSEIDRLKEEAENKWWYNKDSAYSINLKIDNGGLYTIHAFWCGYFEKLYKAKIIIIDNDLEFKV